MPDVSCQINMINYDMLKTTSKQFFDEFKKKSSIGSIDLEHGSFLFGINNATGSGIALGTTAEKHMNPGYPAISFVFTSKILNMIGYSIEQKWALVDYAVLHELGHARGLNYVMPDENEMFDHYTHMGNNSINCIMRPQPTIITPKQFNFCDYHKRILKNCLKVIKMTYSPSDECAQAYLNKWRVDYE